MRIFWRLINWLDLGRFSEGTTKGTSLMQIHAKQKLVPFSKAWEMNLFRDGSELLKIGKTAFSPLSLFLATQDSFYPHFPLSLDEASDRGANYQTVSDGGNEHTSCLPRTQQGRPSGGGRAGGSVPQGCPVPPVGTHPWFPAAGPWQASTALPAGICPPACLDLHLSAKQSQTGGSTGAYKALSGKFVKT